MISKNCCVTKKLVTVRQNFSIRHFFLLKFNFIKCFFIICIEIAHPRHQNRHEDKCHAIISNHRTIIIRRRKKTEKNSWKRAMLPLPHYGDKSSGFSLSRTSEDMDGTLQLIFKIFIIVFNINKGMGNIFLSHALGLNFAMLKKVLHSIKICPIVTILFLGHHVGVSVPPQEHGQYWEFRSYLKRSLLHSNLCTLEQTRKCGFCVCVNMLSSSRRIFFLPYLLCTGSIWQKIEKRQHRLLMDDVQTKARHDWRDDDKFVRPRFGRIAFLLLWLDKKSRKQTL